MSTITDIDWAALDRTLNGNLLRPGSPGYEQARKPAIARFQDSRPRAVARCRGAGDVAPVLRFASAHGFPVAVRGGGHSFAGWSTTTGITIDVSPMSSVHVDGGQARIGGGTTLSTVYERLAAHGVTIPAGSEPTVGIAGLTLGGGLGWLGRRYGLTCDSLAAATVVLADGAVVETAERRHPDLFWALRGGGNRMLGVVTELTFRTVPAPVVTAFRLRWPHTQAAEVVLAWQDWSPGGPAELSASLLVIAGQWPGVHVHGAYLGTREAAAAQLAALVARIGTRPARADSAELPYLRASEYVAESERETAEHLRSEFFARKLPAATVHDLVASLYRKRAAGEYRELDFTPWGRAYNQVPVSATAFPHRDALFLVKHAATADTDWLARSWQLTHPWGTGGVYPNFPEASVSESAYYGANLRRLKRIRARYDPEASFRTS